MSRTLVALTALLSASAVAGEFREVIRRVVPPGVTATVTGTANPRVFIVKGHAATHEDVSDFVVQLARLVLTPRGWGRIVQRRRNAAIARIQLFEEPGEPLMDFEVAELAGVALSDLKVEQKADLTFTLRVTMTRKARR
jgi:hypothetical protein